MKTTRNKLHSLKRYLISFLYPVRCPFCDEVIDDSDYYCEECFERLPIIDSPLDPLENTESFCAVCWYEGIVKGAVWRLKKDRYIYSAETFGKMIFDMLNAFGYDKKLDCIVPVPVNSETLKKRGYNQTELMAREISALSGIPVVKNALAASDKKAEQKTLSARQRAENAKKAFIVTNIADITGRNILLIDDVCTTGSTLSVLAEQLIQHGAISVSCAAFAKTK